MRRRSWTECDLKKAVEKSHTLFEVARELGLSGKGGSIQSIRRGIDEFKVSIEHFSKGSLSHPKKVVKLSDDEIFIKNSKAGGRSVKFRIRKRNLIEYLCSSCGQQPFYNGKELTLHLEHRNGDNKDHRLSNLTFLCPNCHSQTETYCRNHVTRKRKASRDAREDVEDDAR